MYKQFALKMRHIGAMCDKDSAWAMNGKKGWFGRTNVREKFNNKIDIQIFGKAKNLNKCCPYKSAVLNLNSKVASIFSLVKYRSTRILCLSFLCTNKHKKARIKNKAIR